MRGGNRTRPTARPGGAAKVPRPPRDLSALEARIWKELGHAVGAVGTFQPSDLPFFRLMVKTYAAAEEPGDMPATARARVLQAAGAMLNAFGLSPLSRDRVKPIEDTRSTAEKILAAVGDER